MDAKQTELDLRYENVYDALRAAIQHLGGFKKVGHRLWPKKTADEAGRHMADSINPGQARKLDPEETMTILRWARDAGFHGAKHFIDEQTGYEKSRPLNIEDARERLQREFIESVHLQSTMLEEFKRLGLAAPGGPSLKIATSND